MKILLLFLSLLIVTDDATLVTGKGFKGYVFNENQEVFVSLSKGLKRYTPTYDDIIAAELIIKKSIAKVNSERMNQQYGCPVIHKKLRKYTRQYVGFINDKDEKELWVNFVWSSLSFSEQRYKESIISVHDGCSNFWSIRVNINTKNLSDLKINGVG
ncbi:hypothetical protein GR160_12525 [Flavobacterium sp. Sd200]|uniref:hypothetical protein n=1 Tax=Flavobacterium sp. Sd200 TaxID=2692211 RepID=UPI001370B308|nr:hypothetical protein [Flavobacterium sp. Sd200]MXN92052.1 hypothetical protein [Flavobacterium sp. Sd200]